MSASWLAFGLAASLGFALILGALISFGSVECCPHILEDEADDFYEEAAS